MGPPYQMAVSYIFTVLQGRRTDQEVRFF